MLKRGFIVLYLLGLLAPVFTIRASANGIVINSFQIGSESARDEFVEIKNTSTVAVNLKDWRLAKRTETGSENILLTALPDIQLAVGDTFIIAHAEYSSTADVYYSNKSYSLASNNSIVLYTAPDSVTKARTIADLVGYGTAKSFEGEPIKEPSDSEIYSRKNAGQDTDNNKADFYLSYSPPVKAEPEKDSDEKESDADTFPEATVGAKLQVSEFMINPEGSDTEGEWIEIYNAGGDANISGYAIADRLGSPKKYSFPKGTKIKKGQYLAFYSGQTPISLNNDGDAVEIRTPDGSVISYSENSGKGPEGMSFAYDSGKWSWTKRPTPGRVNIIEKPSDEEMSGKKSSKNEGEVLALVDESQLPGELESSEALAAKKNDRLMGYGLIVLAIIGGISYTLHIKKEWLVEHLNKIRDRDHLTGREIWSKIKRR